MLVSEIKEMIKDFSDNDDIALYVPRDSVPSYSITHIPYHSLLMGDGFQIVKKDSINIYDIINGRL